MAKPMKHMHIEQVSNGWEVRCGCKGATPPRSLIVYTDKSVFKDLGEMLDYLKKMCSE